MSRPALRGPWALLVVAILVAACGTPAATPSPVITPRPTPTPDPHLTDPASVDVVLVALNAAGIKFSTNNASLGADGEPVKRVNATYMGWPLTIAQFSSASALRERGFDPTRDIRRGDAQYTLAGLNILVEFGPGVEGPTDPAPDVKFRDGAVALIGALDPLLGPLQHRTIDPQPLPGLLAAAPQASAAP